MLPAKLDYLFTARFKDGSVYRQTLADRSVENPLTRSAYYDVEQRIGEVEEFTLRDRTHEHSVNLVNGHFKTDGQEVVAALDGLRDFELKYWRRVQQVLEGNFHQKTEIVGYFIGWVAKDEKGKSWKMIMEIKPSGSLQGPIVELG